MGPRGLDGRTGKGPAPMTRPVPVGRRYSDRAICGNKRSKRRAGGLTATRQLLPRKKYSRRGDFFVAIPLARRINRSIGAQRRHRFHIMKTRTARFGPKDGRQSSQASHDDG